MQFFHHSITLIMDDYLKIALGGCCKLYAVHLLITLKALKRSRLLLELTKIACGRAAGSGGPSGSQRGAQMLAIADVLLRGMLELHVRQLHCTALC